MAGLRWRAIVDNDFAGDPDGLVSLAHVLLTDDVRVELITCTPVDPRLAELAGVDGSASASLAAMSARALLEVMGRTDPDVVAGAETFAAGESALAAVVGLDPTFRPGGAHRSLSEIDMRLLWGDFLAKLRLHGRETDPR